MRLLQRDSSVPVLILLPAIVSAGLTLDCHHIVADKQTWDLSALGGPRVVSLFQPNFDHQLSRNNTFTIDICSGLKRHKDVPKVEECGTGTRICNLAQLYEPGNNFLDTQTEAFPIAGEDVLGSGRSLDPKFVRLKTSDSNHDSQNEGVQITLHGGSHKQKSQKAVIEFICDHNLSGLEGVGEDDRTPAEDEGGSNKQKREEEEEKKSLTILSYEDSGEGDKSTGVLRLKWKTKYACENVKRDDDEKSSHWGFFTWFIIILFLVLASYLIFGSWLNYSRYGARGWDLVPHGDAIQDIPFYVKDIGRKVVGAFQGSGSRGGYSAV